MSASFATTATWGLVVLVAFVGWGGALGRWLFPERQVDVGLRAAWGMAFTILAGGTASLFSLASRWMVLAFVVLGFGLALAHAFRHLPRIGVAAVAKHSIAEPGSALLLCGCVAGALLQYVGSICNIHFNSNDDFVAYFPFAKQILDTGTLFDPFSTRRVMSFGGHSLLQAVVLAGSAGFRLHMLDQGICLLAAALLILGCKRKGHSGLPALLALIILLTLRDIRANTYSEMSGVVLFYGLYRTLMWLDEQPGDQRWVSSACIVALVASATCTLRSNYMAVCIPMVALSYAHRVWKGEGTRRRQLEETASAAGFSFMFLLPWMLMSYRSSGTPLFPILRGHFNDAFPMMQKPGNWQQQVAALVGTVTQHDLIPTLFVLFLAGFLLPDRGSRRPLHALLLSSIIGWILLVHTLASDVPSFERYVYGFVVAVALAVTTQIAIPVDESTHVRSAVVRSGRVIAAAGALGQIFLMSGPTLMNYDLLLHRVAVLPRIPIRPPRPMPVIAAYRALQERVPPGQTLLVMVDYPFLFDFTRNDIYNIDTAAAVSPPPGFPYFRGAEAIAEYLDGQSIRYLTFVTPQKSLSLYRRDSWEGQKMHPEAFWHTHAPVYLDLFDNLEVLASSRKHLYDDENGLVLLDLKQPATSAATSLSQR
jgi:hypothetical protein